MGLPIKASIFQKNGDGKIEKVRDNQALGWRTGTILKWTKNILGFWRKTPSDIVYLAYFTRWKSHDYARITLCPTFRSMGEAIKWIFQFANVYMAKDVDTGEFVAIKKVERCRVSWKFQSCRSNWAPVRRRAMAFTELRSEKSNSSRKYITITLSWWVLFMNENSNDSDESIENRIFEHFSSLLAFHNL